MKKLLCLLPLLLCLLLTGCHGAVDREAFVVDEEGMEFDDSREYNITFWAKNDTNRVQVNIYNKAIKDFEALYPNIHVTIKLYTDYSKIYKDVITNISTNSTPNVCVSYPDHIATYLTGENVIVELDDLMKDKNFGFGGEKLLYDSPARDEVVEKFLQEGYFDGHQYDLPFMRSSEALYINKDAVEKMGFTIPDVPTWDWVWEVAEKALEKDGDVYTATGQKIMVPFIYKSTDNMMIQLLRQKGAGYATELGEVQIFNDTTKELLYTISAHAKTRAFSTFAIDSYPGNLFNAGRCILAVDSTAGATWIGSDAPLMEIPEDQVTPFETVVRPVPQFDPDNPQMISQGPSICLFNKEDPQEVLASWIFAQYLLTNEVQIAYAQTEGYVPVTKKAQDSAEYQDYLARAGEDNNTYYDVKIAASKLIIDYTENTFITPVFNGSASLRNAAGDLIEITVKSTRRKKTIDDAFFEDTYEEVKALWSLDQIKVKEPAEPGEEPQDPGLPELGEMPSTSVALLSVLAGAWVLIGLAALIGFIRKRKNENH